MSDTPTWQLPNVYYQLVAYRLKGPSCKVPGKKCRLLWRRYGIDLADLFFVPATYRVDPKSIEYRQNLVRLVSTLVRIRDFTDLWDANLDGLLREVVSTRGIDKEWYCFMQVHRKDFIPPREWAILTREEWRDYLNQRRP